MPPPHNAVEWSCLLFTDTNNPDSNFDVKMTQKKAKPTAMKKSFPRRLNRHGPVVREHDRPVGYAARGKK
jgi:hypothetical protein